MGIALVITVIVIIICVLSNGQDKEKNNEKIVEDRLNNDPITLKSKEVYHYATSKNNYINKLNNEIARDILVNNYSPCEAMGILKEIDERKSEYVKTLIGETEDKLKISVEQLLDSKVRPEMIEKSFKEYMDTHNKIDEKVKKVVLCKLENSVHDFDNEYEKIINRKKAVQKSSYVRHTNDYNNSPEPTGLGFGIITNQVSSALMYQAMEKNEIEKQVRNQRITYENSVAHSTGEQVISKLGAIENLYKEFGKEIIECVKYLFNSEKCQSIAEKEIFKHDVNSGSLVLKEEINKCIKEIFDANINNKVKIRGVVSRNKFFEVEGIVKAVSSNFFRIENNDRHVSKKMYTYDELVFKNMEIEFENQESNQKFKEVKELALYSN